MDKALELIQLVVWALGVLGLKDFDALIGPKTANFATIPSVAAVRMAAKMRREPTTSHREAWQRKFPCAPFALKLYRKEGDLWDITIVTTGWRHWLDAVIFHFGFCVSWRQMLNLRNARKVRKLYP